MQFVRKVVPPNEVRRRYLLKKMQDFKGAPDSKFIRQKLRQQLSGCEGYTSYYIQHRGLEIYIGDETTRKKQFLMFKDERAFQPYIRQLRDNKSKTNYVPRRKVISEIGDVWNYALVGGVFEKPGMIAAKDKGIRRWLVERPKSPMTADSYIGLELEYASKMSVGSLREHVADMRLHKQVRVVNDRSIQSTPNFPYQTEICVLSKYVELSETMKKLEKLIVPEIFKANESCGLHVHLDARHGDVRRMYSNLVNMQHLLFRLAAPYRRANEYCRPVISPDITAPFDEDHYAAISKLSFKEHKSIEIRIHHSTLDLKLIENWVRLLKTIADYQGDLTNMTLSAGVRPEMMVERQEDQLRCIKLPEDLLKYVAERLVS